MKIAVNTAIFGGIDTVKEMPAQSVPFNRIIWKGDMNSSIPGKDNREKAIYFKTQPHKLAYADTPDIFVWLDGKVQVLAYDFLEQMIQQLGENDLGVMKHLYRSCIYQEIDHIEHCMRHNNEYLKARYADKPIRRQVESYRDCGYPESAGLWDCCIYIARNTPAVREIFDRWHAEIIHLNAFDQVALPFIAWVSKVKIVPLVFKPASFKDVPHIK